MADFCVSVLVAVRTGLAVSFLLVKKWKQKSLVAKIRTYRRYFAKIWWRHLHLMAKFLIGCESLEMAEFDCSGCAAACQIAPKIAFSGSHCLYFGCESCEGSFR